MAFSNDSPHRIYIAGKDIPLRCYTTGASSKLLYSTKDSFKSISLIVDPTPVGNVYLHDASTSRLRIFSPDLEELGFYQGSPIPLFYTESSVLIPGSPPSLLWFSGSGVFYQLPLPIPVPVPALPAGLHLTPQSSPLRALSFSAPLLLLFPSSALSSLSASPSLPLPAQRLCGYLLPFVSGAPAPLSTALPSLPQTLFKDLCLTPDFAVFVGVRVRGKKRAGGVLVVEKRTPNNPLTTPPHTKHPKQALWRDGKGLYRVVWDPSRREVVAGGWGEVLGVRVAEEGSVAIMWRVEQVCDGNSSCYSRNCIQD